MVGAPTPVAAVTIVQDVTFMTHNYCGTNCKNGFYPSLDNPDFPDQDDFALKIIQKLPYVVAINEICRNQLVKLIEEVGDHTTINYTYSFRMRRETDECLNTAGGSDDIGIAILTRNPHDPGDSVSRTFDPPTNPNPNKAGAPAKILCAFTTIDPGASVDFTACVTHLSTGDFEEKQAQVDQAKEFVLDHTGPEGEDWPAFLGGDFNIEPPEDFLDTFYTGNRYFEEMDECAAPNRRSLSIQGCNRPTHEKQEGPEAGELRKIDYLFFRQAFAQGDAPVAPMFPDTDPLESDHAIYWGTIDICTTNDC
jgi:endonuclease/exonuclease/phosphatase family metal-dependent hydrolase